MSEKAIHVVVFIHLRPGATNFLQAVRAQGRERKYAALAKTRAISAKDRVRVIDPGQKLIRQMTTSILLVCERQCPASA